MFTEAIAGAHDRSLHENLDPAYFVQAIENYTNTRFMLEWLQIQRAASPITLVPNASYIPAVRLYATLEDTVPFEQANDMFSALFARGANVQAYVLEGEAHCFNQWRIPNELNGGVCVGSEIVGFLQSQL